MRSVASVLSLFCTKSAIADASGKIVLQNAKPGQLGTLGLRPIYGPGAWFVGGRQRWRAKGVPPSRKFASRLSSQIEYLLRDAVQKRRGGLPVSAGTSDEADKAKKTPRRRIESSQEGIRKLMKSGLGRRPRHAAGNSVAD